MKIQTVSTYISLSEEGLVPRIECPVDQGLLLSNQDLNDKIYLYCLSCSYKKEIGINLYEQLKSEIKRVS
jgi:hypothetical protein